MRKIALGGTFDHFHKGHMKLIDRAFKERYHVIIGVTTDSFAKKLGKADIEPFELRIKKIREYIERKYLGKSFSIIPLNDPFGPIIEDNEIVALVVSPETLARGLEACEIRERKGLNHLDLYIVPFVLAEDGLPISSTRIRKGEVDQSGRMLKSFNKDELRGEGKI